MIDLPIRTQDPATRSHLRSFSKDREAFDGAEGPRIRTGREIKEVPKEIQVIATRAGGLNLYGEPNYRVVWGWSRLTIIAGEWEDFDRHGNWIRTVGEYRWEPKNMPFDRWHLERWLPPSHFISREHWYEITKEEFNGVEFAALGAFPSRGEYEGCYVFENPDGSYQRLSCYVVETVCRALNYQRNISDQERREAIAKRQEKMEKSDDDFAMALAEDAYPAFHGQLNVGVTRQIERKTNE